MAVFHGAQCQKACDSPANTTSTYLCSRRFGVVFIGLSFSAILILELGLKTMKNNIFIRTAIRQPIRNLVLALLIGAAAFAFVSRAVEYVVVKDNVAQIETFYRSIGFLQHPEFAPTRMLYFGEFHPRSIVNARDAADIVARSPFVHFEDRLRYIQGELPEGMQNANINTPYINNPYIHLMDNIPEEERVSFIYFYGIFDRISPGGVRPTPIIDRETGTIVGNESLAFFNVHVEVDYVTAGYYEHIIPGQRIALRFFIEEEMCNPFEGLEQGQRYFFRAEPVFDFWRVPGSVGNTGSFYARPFNADKLWYLAVPKGARVDLYDPELYALKLELETHKINQSSMRIIATVDMSAMPFFQPVSDIFMLYEGRLITYDDYSDANYVTVVSRGFAQHHDLEIGDSITLTLRDFQAHVIPLGYPGWRDICTQEIELTIIGTFCFTTPWRGPMRQTFIYPTMYVPLSILPDGFGGDGSLLLPFDFSFVLDSPRNERAFLEENTQALRELGFEIIFFEHGADGFIASADIVVQSVTINFIIFAIVSAIVLCLVSFIFLRFNRQSFAILRALGMPIKTAFVHRLFTAVLILLPMIVIGSALAWHFALINVEETLAIMYDLEHFIGVVAPPLSLLFIYCAIYIGATVTIIFLCGLATARLRVLTLLQRK